MAKKTATTRPAKAVLVPLDRIALPPETQMREDEDEKLIASYAEDMVNGDEFPPVEVWDVGTRFVCSDGRHRIRGALKAGRASILAVVHQGSMADAVWAAIGANKQNDKAGLRRSPDTKRRAIEAAFAYSRSAGKNLSDRAIAEHCGVDHKTVAKYRPATGELPQSDGKAGETTGRREGKDGRNRRPPAPRAKPAAITGTALVPVPPAKRDINRPVDDDEQAQAAMTALSDVSDVAEEFSQACLAAEHTIAHLPGADIRGAAAAVMVNQVEVALSNGRSLLKKLEGTR